MTGPGPRLPHNATCRMHDEAEGVYHRVRYGRPRLQPLCPKRACDGRPILMSLGDTIREGGEVTCKACLRIEERGGRVGR